MGSKLSYDVMNKLRCFEVILLTREDLDPCVAFIKARNLEEVSFDLRPLWKFHTESGPEYETDDEPEFIHLDFDGCMTKFAGLVPNLKRFRIYHVDTTQNYAWDFLSSLKKLEQFTCTLYMLTPNVMKPLSQLPDLQIIDFEEVMDEPVPFPRLGTYGSFSRLVAVSIGARYDDITSLLGIDFAPDMSKLYVHSPELESTFSLGQLIERVSQRGHRLGKLLLSSVPKSKELSNQGNAETDDVTLSILAPLAKCNQLTELVLSHHHGLQITDSDIEALVEHWSSIEVLRLCEDPAYLETPSLTLDSLSIIAAHCKKIRFLALFIDPGTTQTLSLDEHRFKALKEIRFGLSPIKKDDLKPVALYFSHVLSPYCDVSSLYSSDFFKLKFPGLYVDDRDEEDMKWEGWNYLHEERWELIGSALRELWDKGTDIDRCVDDRLENGWVQDVSSPSSSEAEELTE